ncbi:MAG: hypothetical protein JWQ03_3093 [Variovorax sp.]|nr:hypothetical protein [Variovorax sp.]
MTRKPARQPEPKPPIAVEDRLLPIEAVMDMVGIKRTMIYRLIRKDAFPQPFKVGGFASRWSEREIMAWKEQVAAARRAA